MLEKLPATAWAVDGFPHLVCVEEEEEEAGLGRRVLLCLWWQWQAGIPHSPTPTCYPTHPPPSILLLPFISCRGQTVDLWPSLVK